MKAKKITSIHVFDCIRIIKNIYTKSIVKAGMLNIREILYQKMVNILNMESFCKYDFQYYVLKLNYIFIRTVSFISKKRLMISMKLFGLHVQTASEISMM